jgi:hypothetical protein
LTITLKLQDDEYIFDDWKIESNHWLPSRKLLTLNGLDKSIEDNYSLMIIPLGPIDSSGEFGFFACFKRGLDISYQDFINVAFQIYRNPMEWFSYGENAIEDMNLKCDVVCKASTNLLSFI